VLEPYKDREWLYFHYVKKRMNMKDIVVVLKTKHNITLTPQGLYNWLSKYDLLKYRGKGRKINANLQMRNKVAQSGKRPDKMREERMRAIARARKRGK